MPHSRLAKRREVPPKPASQALKSSQRPGGAAAGIDEVIIDAAGGEGGQVGNQIVAGRSKRRPVSKTTICGTEKMELLVGHGPGDQLALVEALLHHLEHLLAQTLQVLEVGGDDHAQAFGQRLVVQPPVGPGGEVVVVFRLVELGPQQTPPEMVVDAAGGDLLQPFAEFLAGSAPAPPWPG